MLKKGRKTKEWEKVRAELKIEFQTKGIVHCEWPYPHACWHYEGLSFAHSLKRRNIQGDQIRECALLCPVAHDIVEHLPEWEMAEEIRAIIQNRSQKTNEQHRYDAD